MNNTQTEKLNKLLPKNLSFIKLVLAVGLKNKIGNDAAISSKLSNAESILSGLKNSPAVNADMEANKKG